MDTTIIQKIIEHSRKYPDKLAIGILDKQITNQQFVQKIYSAASYLKSLKIMPRDRIILSAVPDFSYLIGYFAVHLIGAIAVPIDKKAVHDSIAVIENEVQSKFLFLNETEKYPSSKTKEITIFNSIEQREQNEQFFDYPDKEEVADILYTTGTTGKSKGVILTHQNIVSGAINIAAGVEMQKSDIDLVPVPINHAYGLGTLRALFYKGASVILSTGIISVKEIYTLLQQYHCTGISCVPATIKLLDEQTKGKLDFLFGKLRYVEIGSSSLDLIMKQKLLSLLPGVNLYLNYGATESPRTVYMNLRTHQDKLAAIGKPACCAKIQIVDEQLQPINSSPEQIGRLAITGSMNMKGYFMDEELTKTVLKGEWFYTNDIGYIDLDGFIFLAGRKNDVIQIGGKKVSPYEVENVFLNYPGIVGCACIGVQDKKQLLGEMIVAYLVVKQNIEEEKLNKYLSSHLESYKIPAELIFIDKIPTNYMGKVDKNKLKEDWRKR